MQKKKFKKIYQKKYAKKNSKKIYNKIQNLPPTFDTVEHAVGQVKVAALKSEEMLGKWFHTDEVAGYDHRGRIKCTIVIWRCLRVIPFFEAPAELLEPFRRLGPHRLREVTEASGV